jgi:hypothetical protein
VTDLRPAALSLIGAYQYAHASGGHDAAVQAVMDWLRREFAVAEARGRAAALTAYADALDRLVADCRRVVPDLAAVDAGD